MSFSLLVVTPQPSFGEHIRQSLEESNSATVDIVDGIVAALYAAEAQKFTHAFLDMDIKSGSVLDLGLALRKLDPDLRLVIVSPRQSIPRFDALRPWSLLNKPFYIPDLLRVLDQNTKSSLSLSPVQNKKEPKMEFKTGSNTKTFAWLKDVSKAAQHLTRLTLESSAQATLIIRDGELWAYAGQLLEEASAELVKIVARDKKAGDLLKFLRLNATQAEHMLYATKLAEETALVMVFDAETPFSAIRQQAAHLSESLAMSLKASPSIPSIEEVAREESSAEKEDKDLIDLFEFGDDENDNYPPISDILENIPNPNPMSAASEIKTSAPVSTPSPNVPQSSVFDEPMPNPFASLEARSRNVVASVREESPAIREDDYFQAHQEAQNDLAETRVQEARPQESPETDLNLTRVSKPLRPETPVRKPKPDELVETRPRSITEVAGRVILENSSSGMYDLTYACLLVPRFGTHYLTGDLSEEISKWMPDICIAFGWRLEFLSIRPDYLQWVVNVPPTTSPGYLMRIMRKQTSEKIFRDFPRQKDKNPSGDFWAPGYLIMGGSQPHPSKLVKDYINRTRLRQGTGKY
ncbi:MAG: IS200/IS605 family transposase [Anaerolineae bacterium]|nr:IS200/IS605 family transposase [Anaerolineae bacterium]